MWAETGIKKAIKAKMMCEVFFVFFDLIKLSLKIPKLFWPVQNHNILNNSLSLKINSKLLINY